MSKRYCLLSCDHHVFNRHGIRCNAILPGFIETPMTGQVPSDILEKVFHTLYGYTFSVLKLEDCCYYSTRKSRQARRCMLIVTKLFCVHVLVFELVVCAVNCRFKK